MFEKQLVNVLRPTLFRNKLKKTIKKSRGPSQKNEGSKTTLKMRKRRQLLKQNKLRLRKAKLLKRKYKTVVKVLKEGVKPRMDIEK